MVPFWSIVSKFFGHDANSKQRIPKREWLKWKSHELEAAVPDSFSIIKMFANNPEVAQNTDLFVCKTPSEWLKLLAIFRYWSRKNSAVDIEEEVIKEGEDAGEQVEDDLELDKKMQDFFMSEWNLKISTPPCIRLRQT